MIPNHAWLIGQRRNATTGEKQIASLLAETKAATEPELGALCSALRYSFNQLAAWTLLERVAGHRPNGLEYQPWSNAGSYFLYPDSTVRGREFRENPPWANLALTTPGNQALNNPAGIAVPYMVNSFLEQCLVHLLRLWGFRGHRVQRGNKVSRCTFRDIDIEHGWYDNQAGVGPGVAIDEETDYSLWFDKCLFEDIGSQGIQRVGYYGKRAKETSDPAFDDTPGLPLRITNTVFRNVTLPTGGRPANVISLQEPCRSGLYMADVEIDNTMQDLSFGGLVVVGFQDQSYARRIVMEGRGAIMLPKGDRPLVSLQYPGDVTISGWHFDCTEGHPQPWIDCYKPLVGHRIRVTGCSGPDYVRLRYRGVDIGPISGEYDIDTSMGSLAGLAGLTESDDLEDEPMITPHRELAYVYERLA